MAYVLMKILLVSVLLVSKTVVDTAPNSDRISGSGQGSSSAELDLSITREPLDGECLEKSKVSAVSNSVRQNGASAGITTGDHSSICTGIEWNSTFHTNLLGHKTDSKSTTFWMGNFQPLIRLKCSSNTERFLCSLALPICSKKSNGGSHKVYIIPPCRELCEQVQFGCEASMNAYGFDWPYPCNVFPSNDTAKSTMCVPPIAVEYRGPEDFDGQGEKDQSRDPIPRDPSMKFVCPERLSTQRDLDYSFMRAKDCSAPCKQTLFSTQDYDVARYWIGAWSFVCFISSLFTFFTYLVDRRRFKYPERPIIILSSCYVFISVTFLIGFSAQKSISCNTEHLQYSNHGSSTSGGTNSNSGTEIITQGLSNIGCTISFVLLYYFLMASSFWWVVLSFTWLLAAGLKWSHEAIERKAVAFHAFAWSVPLVLTLLVLFFRGVEGDDISGTCFTGIVDPNFTLLFVLLPLVISLLFGFTFLVVGFVSLCRVRHFIKKNGDRTDKLEKLMIRIGVFSLFYMVPAIILISCFFYEYRFRNTWYVNWWNSHCGLYQSITDSMYCMLTVPASEAGGPSSPMNFDSQATQMHTTANFYVFLLRYFVTLAVGITSSFWLWSKKTIDSWRNVLCMKSIAAPSSNNPLIANNPGTGGGQLATQGNGMTKKMTTVNSPFMGTGAANAGATPLMTASAAAPGGNRKTHLGNVPGAAFV